MSKIAVFASGNGTNFEVIAKAAQNGEIDVEIVLLVCDNMNANVISLAKKRGIDAFVFDPASYPGKDAYEAAILAALTDRDVTFLVLAGYMRLIGKRLLEAYPMQIVNIHPSLLPLFPGKDAIRRAFESGALKTGVSIHYVDEGMDTGQVIAQADVEIKNDDTLDRLTCRVHKTEHALYVQTLKELFQK